jgi:hypothetical protein
MRDGVCILECDVTAVIDYKVDRRHNELEWWVDEYRLEGDQYIWGDKGESLGVKNVCVVVPEKLAEVFDDYLDKDWMDEQVRERLADSHAGDDGYGDYLRDMAMDR